MIDSRPHIVIATTAFHPFIGGAEVAVAEIISRTKDQFRYTIVTARLRADVPEYEVCDGYTIIRVGTGSSLDKIRLIYLFPKIVEGLQADLVWAIMASYAGAAALIAHKLYKIPYALTLQEGDDLGGIEKRVGIFLPFFKQIFIRAVSVQTIAPFLAVWARKMGAGEKITVIPNGVDVEKFSCLESDRKKFRIEVRTELGIPENAPVVLTTSRLVAKNGVGDLILAVQQLDNFHLIIIGAGELQDDLQKQAEQNKDRIYFLGSKKQEELIRFAAAADVFCRPAHSEGQGIVFLEALAMELPIVATNVGGIPEMLAHEETALLVEAKNIPAIAGAIKRIFEDASLRESFKINGKKLLERYNWDSLAKKIADWLLVCLP